MSIKEKVIETYLKIFGEIDLHNHIRQRAIKKFIKNDLKEGISILDIGCGNGSIAAFLTKNNRVTLYGIDFDADKIKKANSMGIDNFYFEVKDVKELDLDKKYDQIWLFDVLEHVDNPELLLEKILPHLKGNLVISVPTDDFPKVFGEDFDRLIGHQRHYDVSDLEKCLVPLGYEVIAKDRYTQGLARMCCKFWAKKIRGHGIRTLTLFPLLNILSLSDGSKSSKKYCSVLIKAIVKH